RTTLRGDGPENIGQIFEAKFGGVVEAQKPRFNFHAVALAIDPGFTRGSLHEFGTLKINFGRASGTAIVDGFGGAGNGARSGDRRRSRGLRRTTQSVTARGWRRLA